MKEDNFWGTARLSGIKVGIIVRTGLALLVTIGSIALFWTLLSTHKNAHAVASISSPSGVGPIS